MRYHPFHHFGLKVLSIVLASLLWLTVARDPTVERTLRVPLQFQNVPPGLQIVGDPTATVDVLVRGSSGFVSRLQPGEVVAILDLSGARTGSRLFHLVTDQVRAPFGLDVQHVAPATIALQFERTSTKQVPVVPAIEGDPAPGFVVGTIVSVPAQVEVVGPESDVRTVTEAATEPVSVAGATATFHDRVTIGIADSEVRVSQNTTAMVTVTITPAPIEQSFDRVPVRVRNLADRLQASAAPVAVEVSVRGTREALRQVSAQSLVAFVDLAGLGAGRYNLPVRIESSQPVGIGRVDPATISVRIR